MSGPIFWHGPAFLPPACFREGDVGDAEERIDFPAQDLYLHQVENLADAVLNGTPTRVSLADSRRNTETLVALYESARTGRPVALSAA